MNRNKWSQQKNFFLDPSRTRRFFRARSMSGPLPEKIELRPIKEARICNETPLGCKVCTNDRKLSERNWSRSSREKINCMPWSFVQILDSRQSGSMLYGSYWPWSRLQRLQPLQTNIAKQTQWDQQVCILKLRFEKRKSLELLNLFENWRTTIQCTHGKLADQQFGR